MPAPTTTSERRGTCSVNKVAKLGSELQRLMNLLFRETSTDMSGDSNANEDYGSDDDGRVEDGGRDISGFSVPCESCLNDSRILPCRDDQIS